MAGLASLMGANAPLPYYAYRANYEIKQGNSYTNLNVYLEKKKALLRQDDSNYLFLDWQSIDQLDYDLKSCVAWNDRICVEHLNQPVEMAAGPCSIRTIASRSGSPSLVEERGVKEEKWDGKSRGYMAVTCIEFII